MKRTSKILTLVLVIAMVMSLASVAALADSSETYDDVVAGKWYVQYVDWAVENGLMDGISAKEWAPNTATTRGMVITTLYALAGKPEVEGDSPFADVAEGKYYTDAVKWAVEAGVASGKSDDAFGPNDNLTRQEAATFFCAFAKNVWDLDVSDVSEMNKFPDKDDVSDYAKSAMGWAVKSKVISGSKENGETKLMPKRNITRAELATMLKALKALEPGDDPVDPTPAVVNYSDITVTVKYADEKENVKGKSVHIRGVDKNGNVVTVGGLTDKHGVVTFKNVPVSGDNAYQVWEEPVDTNLYATTGSVKNPMAVKVNDAKTDIVIDHQFKQKLVRVAVNTEDVWSTLEGIEVQLKGKSSDGKDVTAVTTTDKMGRADFNVPAGEYVASFKDLPAQYTGDTAEVVIDEKYPFTFDEDVEVMESNPTAWYYLNIKLKTSTFEVALIDEDGNPVKIDNVKLTLSGRLASGARAPRNSVVTDQNGVAKFNGIPYSDAAGYTMSVVNKTLKDAKNNDYEVVEIRTNPVVVKDATHDKVFVVLKKVTKGILNVTVINDEGTPLTDVEVRLKDEDGNIVKKDLSDDDGVVAFKNIEAGKYFIDYDEAIPGYTINTDKLVSEKITDKDGNPLAIVVENKKVINKTLVYDHDVGKIKVTVVDDETGEGIANVLVQASGYADAGRDDDAVFNAQQTDLAGVTQFNDDDLFTGVYKLTVKGAPKQYSKDIGLVLVSVTKDDVAEVEIRLQKATGSIVIKVVKDDENRTLSGLNLVLSGKAADGSKIENVAADSEKDGEYTFTGLPVGNYKVSVADASGDKEKGQEYVIVDDDDVVINEGVNDSITVKAKLVGTEDTEKK